MTRRARILTKTADLSDTVRRVAQYLPTDYGIIGTTAAPEYGERYSYVLIGGDDVAGWTLDGYVIPRLASGLYFAEEV